MISRRQYWEDKLGLTEWTWVPKSGLWIIFSEQWGAIEGFADEERSHSHHPPGRVLWQVSEFGVQLENEMEGRRPVKFTNVPVKDAEEHNSGNNCRDGQH